MKTFDQIKTAILKNLTGLSFLLILILLISSCLNNDNNDKKDCSVSEVLNLSKCSDYTSVTTTSDKWGSLPSYKSINSTIPLVLILTEFTDATFTHVDYSGDEAAYWSDQVFSETTGKLNHYFKNISADHFTFSKANESYNSLGAVNDGVIKVTLSRAHPDSQGSQENSVRTDLMNVFKLALDAADPYIDFSNYDTVDDGRVNPQELQIMFVFAGNESATDGSSPAVWAGSSNITGFYGVGPLTYDGHLVANSYSSANGFGYSVIGEIHFDNYPATIGIMAHELGHAAFGLPDLLDTDGSSVGIGDWGLMGKGRWGQTRDSDGALNGRPGDTPVPMSAWSKTKLFFDAIDVTADSNEYTYTINATGSQDNVLRIITGAPHEYFLLENRHNSGYDEGLERTFGNNFDGGLAIWHIDDGRSDNWVDCHRIVDLESAGGSINENTNLFYNSNQSTFNSTSSPNSNLYSGNGIVSNISVTDISAPGPTMTVTVTAP